MDISGHKAECGAGSHGHSGNGGHHHHHVQKIASLNGIFISAIALNAAYVIIEAVVGWKENSLGLLSDAGHNLGDVFSLLLALFAFKLSKVKSNRKYTYGYKKSTVLISLVNAIILLVAVGAIVIESLHKFSVQEHVNGSAVSWTAGVGIVVNGITAMLLMKSQKKDLNVKGAFLHMVSDTLVSVGVVISGIIMTATGWYMADPVISLVIAAVILVSTWKLLSESVRMSLDGIPGSIDIEKIDAVFRENAHVDSVHHLHVWAISTTDVALTAHVVIDDLSRMAEIKDSLKHELHEIGINHSTLEIEGRGEHCHSESCDCAGDSGL